MEPRVAMALHMRAFDIFEEMGGLEVGLDYEEMHCMAEQVLVGPR